jgi:uncharacterized membrane protein
MCAVLLSITEFIGHLHPVLVHLPIGILLLACLLIWQTRKDKYAQLQPAIHVILLIGMVSAIASCITGYILSGTGDYEEKLVGLHQWMGISVAAISVLLYYLRAKDFLRWQSPLAILLLLLLFVTGHLGGSLTHGSDYLTEPLKNLSGVEVTAILKPKPIPNIQEAFLYTDVVQPIMQNKCYSCHGAGRQKGKLRMDQTDLLMKGGKDGVVIVPGKSAESELIKRILLPREQDHHMPPKEKTPLNDKEITLLEWWVNQGASFTKKIKELSQPEKMKPLLLSLQNDTTNKNEISDVPSAPVEKADGLAIQKLKDRGAVIMPVGAGSNYLEGNFITVNSINDSDIHLLLPLRKQLVWLKLEANQITDSALVTIGQCTSLTRLQLDHTTITDSGMNYLKHLDSLQTLNLVGTKVTAAGVLNLYQSGVNKNDWDQLKKAFPKVYLDSGGYSITYLQTDTMIVKPPKTSK